MIRCLLLLGLFCADAVAQTESVPDSSLFAVEFRMGPSWDNSKPAQEQSFFKDHSANLKKLRSEGRIVAGARYGEVGLIVVRGTSENDVRTLIDTDPSVRNGIFKYDLNAMNVFYPGYLSNPSKKQE